MSLLWVVPCCTLAVAAWAVRRGARQVCEEAARTAAELDLAALALRDLTDQSPEANALVDRMGERRGDGSGQPHTKGHRSRLQGRTRPVPSAS